VAKIIDISGTNVTDRGIARLIDYCRGNLSDDYTLIIGCLPYTSDVDGILIGRGNIYAIECKDWKGEIEGSTYGYWTKDREIIRNPLHQTRNNTVALAKWLREKTGLNGSLWVKGLLVFTHDKCALKFSKDVDSNSTINVIKIKELKDHLYLYSIPTSKSDVIEKVTQYFNEMERSIKMSNESYTDLINVIMVLTTLLTVVLAFLNKSDALLITGGIFFILTLIYGIATGNIRAIECKDEPGDGIGISAGDYVGTRLVRRKMGASGTDDDDDDYNPSFYK